jgi:hypothetical protein
MKAHVDHGAWARTQETSSNRRVGDGSVGAIRGVAVNSYGGYRAWDDGALTSGELLPDLASLLEALGGPTPHPAVTLAAECVVRGVSFVVAFLEIESSCLLGEPSPTSSQLYDRCAECVTTVRRRR